MTERKIKYIVEEFDREISMFHICDIFDTELEAEQKFKELNENRKPYSSVFYRIRREYN